MKKIKIGMVLILTAVLFTACGTKDTISQKEKKEEAIQKNETEEPMQTEENLENTEENKTETEALFGTFSTIDLEGNKITEDIFSDYEITMVNIWATTCPPCIDEMPELGTIHEEYKEKGVQVVGLAIDTLDANGEISESQVSTAKDIVEATKANYTHILPSMELYLTKLKDVSAVPETIFLDKDGVQIGKSYLGARTEEDWKVIIDNLLEEVKENK